MLKAARSAPAAMNKPRTFHCAKAPEIACTAGSRPMASNVTTLWTRPRMARSTRACAQELKYTLANPKQAPATASDTPVRKSPEAKPTAQSARPASTLRSINWRPRRRGRLIIPPPSAPARVPPAKQERSVPRSAIDPNWNFASDAKPTPVGPAMPRLIEAKTAVSATSGGSFQTARKPSPIDFKMPGRGEALGALGLSGIMARATSTARKLKASIRKPEERPRLAISKAAGAGPIIWSSKDELCNVEWALGSCGGATSDGISAPPAGNEKASATPRRKVNT